MKLLLLAVVVGVTLGSCLGVSLEQTWPNELLLAEWQEFKTTHGKVYADTNEEDRRFQLYLATRLAVAKHNHEQTLGLHSYRQTVNKFADIETSEFLGSPTHNGNQIRRVKSQHMSGSFASPPVSIDWRKTGGITPVKDQGTQCNSGYAFATIAGVESLYAIHNISLRNISLSEQQIIDCDESSKGCKDGNIYSAADYLYQIGSQLMGVESEVSYPYTGEQTKCNYDQSKGVVPVQCYMSGGRPNETDMLVEVGIVGPGMVGIYVADTLKQYSYGIYDDPQCSKAKNYHYVLLVGYGTDDQEGDYWIAKNSWGNNWGESGFFRIARNKGNICGVSDFRVQFCWLD